MESMALWIVLAVLILFIVLMLSGKFDFAGVGLTCLAILVLTGVASISQALSGFYDKNVVMLVGMFAIAGMLGQTDFVEKIKDVLLSGGGNKQAGNLRLVFFSHGNRHYTGPVYYFPVLHHHDHDELYADHLQ